MLTPWPGAKNRQPAKAFFGSVEESDDFRGSCGGHLTDDWRCLVAGGQAAGLADPPAANKARALPLRVESVERLTWAPCRGARRGSSGNSLTLSSVRPNNSP
jgi:hypothetical protein